MATETSFPGPGDDCCSTAGDAALQVDPSETPETEEEDRHPEKPAEAASQSPPTATTPKKISFSISSLLDDGVKASSGLQQVDNFRLAATSAGAGPGTDNSSKSAQLTFFYREKLLCSPTTQPSSDDGRSADALISSWTVPPTPTSPFVYCEYGLLHNIILHVILIIMR